MSSLPHNPHVLLIEDSDDDAYFFARLLKKSECLHRYTHLPDGRVALAYLGECLSSSEPQHHDARPDLVFIDLKLPVVSGFEILEWLAARKTESRLEIAVLSGSDQPTDVARAAALGATDYIVKPLRLEQLRSRLQRWQPRSATEPGRDRAGAA